jgi:hypothetical protein
MRPSYSIAWTCWPGCRSSRSRIDLGMTTWNLGEMVTVVITDSLSIRISYNAQYIDRRPLRQRDGRSVLANVLAGQPPPRAVGCTGMLATQAPYSIFRATCDMQARDDKHA